jgi:hypothetical protein
MDNFPNIQFYTWGGDDVLDAMGIAGHETDWLQICWVWDGTSSSILYSNGVMRGSPHMFGSGINTTQTEVDIGRSYLTSGYFPGVIDEVRIYNTAFTGNQIQSLYDNATNPATVSSLASTTGETTATITWNTSTSSDSTLWYGTTSGTYTTSTSSASLVTSHSFSLTNLSNVTKYYFIAVSKDAAGDISTSSEETFTTVDLTPPVISSIAASSTNSGAVITWSTNENSSSKVVYSTGFSYASSTSETDTSPRIISHSKTILSLSACTTYNYEVVSSDSAGNYATSTNNIFTTLGCAGDAIPSSATTTTVTVASAATSTDTDGSRTFTVSTPSNFTATSSSVVIQIKGLSSDTVLGSIGKPVTSLSSAASLVFDVTALINNTTTLDSFDSPVTISYTYTDADVSGLDENSLSMYHYHDGSWIKLDNCSVNTSSNTITCSAPSFSIFAIFGTPATTSNSSSSSSSGGSTVQSQVASLIAMGQIDQANALKAKWYWLFPQASASSTATTVRDLKLGMTGNDVLQLQKFLNTQGYTLAATGAGAPGSETTIFGSRTRTALAKFQAGNTVAPAIGYFGPITRAKIKTLGLNGTWW